MNGEVNCILSVCCPEGSEAQLNALTSELTKAGVGKERAEARRYATWILANFDLAEKGTLTAFKASIAKLARQQPGA